MPEPRHPLLRGLERTPTSLHDRGEDSRPGSVGSYHQDRVFKPKDDRTLQPVADKEGQDLGYDCGNGANAVEGVEVGASVGEGGGDGRGWVLEACANTERLVLESFMANLSLVMPLDAVLDLDDDALLRAASVGNSDDDGDGRGTSLVSAMKGAPGTPTGTGTGTGTGGGGGRPYSFSRVKHLSLLKPLITGLDELSLIRYCHNLESLHWDAIAPTFATDVSSNPYVPATPPVLSTHAARRENHIWKNLESLHLGGDGATDMNLATILQWCFCLTTQKRTRRQHRLCLRASHNSHLSQSRVCNVSKWFSNTAIATYPNPVPGTMRRVSRRMSL